MSFDNQDVYDDRDDDNDDDDDRDDEEDDDDGDDHEYADDVFAGDDPPVPVPGCPTEASQFQVNDIFIYRNSALRYDISEEVEKDNNCCNFSKKSSEILNEYFYSHLSNPYPRYSNL